MNRLTWILLELTDSPWQKFKLTENYEVIDTVIGAVDAG